MKKMRKKKEPKLLREKREKVTHLLIKFQWKRLILSKKGRGQAFVENAKKVKN